jgi:hypothetical protein
MNLTLPKETLGRMLLSVFANGAAYGADGIRPDDGETKREATETLFCEVYPGFEESTRRDRAKDTEARALLADPSSLEDPWATLDETERGTVILALTSLATYSRVEAQNPEMGASYSAAMSEGVRIVTALLRKLDPEPKT